MSQAEIFKFRLYVADDTQNSARAAANLDALCKRRLLGRYETEVVDVLREPKRALEDGVLMTPTLVKLAPGPVKKIVGTLSNEDLVVQILGLDPVVA